MDTQRPGLRVRQRDTAPVGGLPGLGTALIAAVLLVASVAAPSLAQGAGSSPAPGETSQTSAATAPGELPFPATIAGVPLEVRTFSGPEWIAVNSANNPDEAAYVEQTQALLDSLGKSIDDLTVQTALAQPSEGTQAVIAAVRIADTEATTYIRELVRLLLGDLEQPELVMRQTMAGRWILRVVDAAMPGVYPRTVYLDGDTAWIMGVDEEYVEDLVSQLPPPRGPASVEPELLAAQLPAMVGGQRRAGLIESIEPLILPTLSESLGPAFEAWLLDLYLEEGISPTDIIGAVAWWGLQGAEEGIEVEGYLVPDASAEMTDRLLKEVILAGGEAVPGEVGRVEEELAGRPVTTIDRGGGARRHVLTSNGIVWVVTDHAGQPELAAEAIAALP